VWKREVDGLQLTFRLAGINNQNFLMRDEETGTFWQQISGAAIAGPLKGRSLELIPSDELTFALWKTEQPNGTVLKEAGKFAAQYAKKDWEVRMQKTPTVLSYAQPGLTPRTLVIGLRAFGAARAYPHEMLLKEKLVQDRVGGVPVLIVVGPDGQSLRAFRSQLPGANTDLELYRTDAPDALMLDDATSSHWNFHGCAVDGKARGTCLQRLNILKDYWFDWRHYNPGTTVFNNAPRTR
jgi:hypothetical protein